MEQWFGVLAGLGQKRIAGECASVAGTRCRLMGEGNPTGAVDAVEGARPSSCTCIACKARLEIVHHQKGLQPRARAR